MPDRVLRLARTADAQGLALLAATAFSDDWPANYWLDQFNESGASVFVAEQAGCIVGYLFVRRVLDEAEILSIATSLAFRRQGIARDLLSHAVAELRRNGPCRLFLEVSIANTSATAMYIAQGFRTIGTRKGYYRQPNGPPVDAIVMALDVSG